MSKIWLKGEGQRTKEKDRNEKNNMKGKKEYIQ